MMALPVETVPTLRACPARMLFRGDYVLADGDTTIPSYDVSRDGRSALEEKLTAWGSRSPTAAWVSKR